MPNDTSFWNRLIGSLPTMFGRGKPAYSTQQKPEGANEAYAQFYPTYEVTSPQYQTPSPYPLAQVGYRENELAYACINERAENLAAVKRVLVKRLSGETDEEIKDHPLTLLMREPCPGYLTLAEWLRITETYLLIAGVCYWEIERNNRGEPIALWPMRPDWCSTYRGEGQPLRAIRYQPYGLPPLDIPVADVLYLQYFDPLWPLLKGLSPTAVALRIIGTDTSMTEMVKAFLTNGAFLGGMLKTEQALNDAEATRARVLWQQSHGGAENAGQIAVLGKGIEFKPTQNTFREMVFPEVDARSESRICMTYRVSPLVISAKVGIGVATYNNYAEARKAQAERVTVPEWDWIADNLWQQLLPQFDQDYRKYGVEFDLRSVKVLQEESDALHARAREDAKSNLITRDEAREIIGYDPIDDEPVFIGSGGAKTQEDQLNPPEPPPALAMAQDGKIISPDGEQKPAMDAVEPPEQDGDEAKEEAEKFKAFAKHRIKEGKYADIPAYEFKHLSPEHAASIVAMYAAPALIEQMSKAMKEVTK